ncbi:MAG: DUF1349 domain-containing protein [Planctomycetia bacterium]|nr:DUF1349 domain-containing protein [Planctomycetia bacterium]
MVRTVLLFVLFSVAVAAVAAPAPPPSEKQLLAKHWGTTEGWGEFTLAGKQLTIRSNSGAPTRGINHRDRMNMPRATRTVVGDFEATVKVLDATAPNKDSKHEYIWPMTRAGLFVSAEGVGLELFLQQYHSKVNNTVQDELRRCVWLDTWVAKGGTGQTLKVAEPGKSTYLRITRKEKTVTVSYSFDGKEWAKPFNPRRELALPEVVTVGVFLSNTTHQIAEARFDNFTVEDLNEKPK